MSVLGWNGKASLMTDADNDCALRNRVARLLQMASEARAKGQLAVAEEFTAWAAELLDRISSDGATEPRNNRGY